MRMKTLLTPKSFVRGSTLLAGLLVTAATFAQPVTPVEPPPPAERPDAAPVPCMNAPCPPTANGHLTPPCGPRSLPDARRPATSHHTAMVQVLGLTQEQQAQLSTLSSTTQEQIQTLREQLKETREQFSAELVQATLNKATLAQLQARQTELENQINMLRTNARIQAADILTPEQRTAWAQQIQTHEAHAPASRRAPHGRPGGHRPHHPIPPVATDAPPAMPVPEANTLHHFGWLLMP